MSLPAGTVTFLFTDIEGSTRLWEEMPDAMAVALAKHDQIMRETIEATGGHVFKTVGDAFCAAFANASDALEATLEIQRKLSQTNADPIPIKVRMGLHSGTAEQRDNDYFGPTLNRTARIQAVGHGGQVLLSEACQSLVRGSLPPDCSLFSLGIHRLKDLGMPETIFQLMHPDLAPAFPPLKSLGTQSSTLPQYLSRFIGREEALESVRKLITEARLATLTGAGGCGKTRLATQAAADLVDAFPDGVWFLEFAPLSDPAMIEPTIAEALGVKLSPGEAPHQTLARAIGSKSMLLIFDNCEHLLDAASTLAAALLRTCPTIHILATSREALGIDGERTFRVPSLEIPESGEVTAASVRETESAQLFIDRARLSNSEFDIDDLQAKPLASICSRLDGIPLALELAASRTRVMSVEQIEQNLDQRFRLLTGGSRAALPRQQTLRSMIDWSFALLSEEEKILLRRLSVFAGSWSLEAAEVVCGDERLESLDVLDRLASLIDKSLVVRLPEGRYRFLETIRQYARDQLMASDEAATLRERHLKFFIRLAEGHKPTALLDTTPKGTTDFVPEQENLEAAQEFVMGQPEYAEQALTLALCTGLHWWSLGRLRYPLEHLLAAISVTPTISMERAVALHQAARFQYLLGEYQAAANNSEAAKMDFEALGHMEGVCAALNSRATSLHGLHGGYMPEAYMEALDVAVKHGFTDYEARIRSNLALNEYYQGNLDKARAGLERALELVRLNPDPIRLAILLNNLTEACAACKDVHAARGYLTESMSLLRESPVGRGPSTYSFESAAFMSVEEGRFREAISLFACARSLREKRGAKCPPYEVEKVDRELEKIRSQLSEEEFQAAWDQGWQMSFTEAWDLCARILTSQPTTV